MRKKSTVFGWDIMKVRINMKKKLLLLGSLLGGMLLFTSCKVNWFGASYDVPWWVIAVPVGVVLVVSHVRIVKRSYRCSSCGEIFRPKWYNCIVWFHMGNKRMGKCPKCGHIGFCKKVKSGEEDER